MFFPLIFMMKKEYKFECLNNDHIFQHNGFINVDKKYLETFLSKNRGYKKVL